MVLPGAGELAPSSELKQDGTLHLRAPSPQSRTRLSEILSGMGLHYEVRPTILSVYVAPSSLQQILDTLVERLSAYEALATQAIFHERERPPDVELMFSAVSLSVMYRRQQLPPFIEALQHDGAQTWFQPIVPAHAPEKPFGYEALLRVRIGEQLLSGYEVFELARAADILMNVDRIARVNAVRAARDRGIREHLFLNFNPAAVLDPVFGLNPVIRRAATAGLALDRLCFEIVESERIHDAGHVRAIIDEHRERGCKFALDDLGAGYASLNLVHRLRPDFIKIDMELVRDVDGDAYKQTIVRHVIDLAKSLQILTIGEGVETAGEFEWLAGAGIDYVQGYYIAAPAFQPPLKSR